MYETHIYDQNHELKNSQRYSPSMPKILGIALLFTLCHATAMERPQWAGFFANCKNDQIDSVRFPFIKGCLLYTSPSPRDRTRSRMPSSA